MNVQQMTFQQVSRKVIAGVMGITNVKVVFITGKILKGWVKTSLILPIKSKGM